MAVCPKCGERIDHLTNYALMWRELDFKLEDEKPVHVPTGDIILSQPLKEEYNCPRCDAVLFKAEDYHQVDEAEKKAGAFLSRKG